MNFNDIVYGVKSLFTSHKSEMTTLGSFDRDFWGTSNGTRQLLELYKTNPRLSVVHKISEDNGATSFSISTTTKKGVQKINNHPLELEIRKHSVPNFFSLWTAYRLLTGIVYIVYDFDLGYPGNFKVFTNTHLISKTKDAYEFRCGDAKLTYPATQVIVDLDPDLQSPYDTGAGRTEAIKDEIETDEFVQKYIKYFYINSARPDLIISAEKGEEMSVDDVRRIESDWLRKYQGIGNAHKPVFLNWAASITSVPTNHKEMELLETRKFYRDTSIQHFGVPPEIMGIVENSNKATVIAAEHIYAKQVRKPLLDHKTLIINTKLMPLYKNSRNMVFSFDNIVPDDVELKLLVTKQGCEYSTITVDEWRVAHGFPKLLGERGSRLVGAVEPSTEEPSTPSNDTEDDDVKDYALDNFKMEAEAILGVPLDDGMVEIIPQGG